MFSIFGVVSSEERPLDDVIRKMFDAIAGRGGDTEAVHRRHSPCLGLGVRGSEQYVSRALVKNASESIVAVIEGEIYNERELGSLLGDALVSPDKESVFSTIIPLYEKFGKDFPKYLNGIFVIVLWDRDANSVYMARDHLGGRSLFYTIQQNSLLFASGLQALLQSGLFSPALSETGIYRYLSSTAISPPYTMFEDVYCLRPGTVAVYHQGRIAEHDYWGLKDIQEEYSRTEDDFTEELRELILDSIRLRADYGGTFGSLLSGGIDSSLIAATLVTHKKTQSFPGCSIAFDEQYFSDAPLQQIMYQRYPIEKVNAILRIDEFAKIFQQAAAFLDSPVNDHAYVGMYKAFELVKETGCSVGFDGIGADQIFCSTTSHGEREFQRFLRIPSCFRQGVLHRLFPSIPLGNTLPHKVLRLLYRIGLADDERHLTWIPSFYDHRTPVMKNHSLLSTLDPLSVGKAYIAETALRDPLNIYHYGLIKTFLPDDLVFKNERMASANHIVNRMPFLDFRLAEQALKTPQHFKIRQPSAEDDGARLIYKKAIQGLLPDEILFHKKERGFSHPTSVWFRHELKDLVHDTLFSPQSRYLDFVDKAYVHQIFSEHTTGKVNHDYLLNSLMILEFWLKAFTAPSAEK
ncbi:hypothetical protein CSB45_04955 [candidate division KSB3 bacterium]|uniref:asparagine synthase (glutamine-hydrolyzing) n=1 Tax=candidate division KSB3 bacterium TaxID=2044937 RepID=A0A2G6E8D1_9BACT|nr:MAG: hypothetical protein CSB45_04955 [candidate division KSB3 bacterium]PIE30405.1 MAG: hypothetical protein CSA57_03725 [candidate division KSB3 bacterium]